MRSAILAEGLVKRFGPDTVVDGIDLSVPEGRVLGLLGPNGAGKTTTVRMLSTLVRPDGGRALVGGYDVVEQSHQVRKQIGLTGQYASVDEGISGKENLYMIARLLDMPRRLAWQRVDELLENFDLVHAASRHAGTYSGGMRRRLDLAASLVGNPAVLYLDEPTTGLDPRSRANVWTCVRELVADGTTVLLTTQYMEEAEALADSVVVMDQGKVVARGTSRELRARVGGAVLHVELATAEDVYRVAGECAATSLGNVRANPEDRLLSVPVVAGNELTEMVRVLGASGATVTGMDTTVPSLDEVFLMLTDKRETSRSANTTGAAAGGLAW